MQQAKQAPFAVLQHMPGPHAASVVHRHIPHWRVDSLQHSPAVQSPSVWQHVSHAPPLQHSPFPQSESTQQAALVHCPPQQISLPGHCVDVVHPHVWALHV